MTPDISQGSLIRPWAIVHLVILIFFSPAPVAAADSLDITILYTNSLNGNIDFCSCRESPKGGLVKRGTEVGNLRRKFGRVFLFETGDFFTYDPNSLLAGYIVRAYREIGYDAMVFGDQEFTVGAGELSGYLKILPFVADNISFPGSAGRLPRYRIIEKGNVRIGVIGTISPNSFRYYPSRVTRDIRVGPQPGEIARDAEELRRLGVQLIVLLSHSGYDEDRELLKSVRGLHVIIGGHSQTLVKNPVLEGNTVIVQAGADGARIGVLELRLSGGVIRSVKNSFRHPTEAYPADDASIRRLIDEYRDRLRMGREKAKTD